MPANLYLTYVVAALVLIVIPGPNVALICSVSVARGARYGMLTVAGTSLAMVLQLALTILGMSAVMAVMAGWFDVLRWLGVAYLVWLGVQAWRAPAVDLTSTPPRDQSAHAVFARGFLISITNPKTLLFHGAFLPQFVSDSAPALPQLLLLAGTFIVLAVISDSLWGLCAARFRQALAVNGKLRNRLTGTLLIAAGLGLSLARRT